MAKVKKAWLVGVDGEIKRLPDLEGKEVKLAAMYPHIGNGCYIVERVTLKKGVDMWVDENGLLKENYLNEIGTRLYRQAFPYTDPRELGVVGNAIIIDNTKAGDFF